MLKKFFDNLIPPSHAKYLPLALLLFVSILITAINLPSIYEMMSPAKGDAVAYIRMAEAFSSFSVDTRGLKVFPPIFPFLLALFPGKPSLLSSIIMNSIMFNLSIMLVYLIGLRHSNTLGATVSASLWATLLIRGKILAITPLSEPTFICFALLAVLLSRPLSVGVIGGLAALVRPEGMLIAGLLSLRQPNWRKRFICIGALVIILLPYWLFLHSTYGHWTVSGKADFNKAHAPYVASGIPYGSELSEKEVAIISHYSSLPNRIIPAVSKAADHLFIHYFYFPLLGFAGIIFCRNNKLRFIAIAFMLSGLGWLPYFYNSPRFFFPLLAGLAISSSGISMLFQSIQLRFSSVPQAASSQPATLQRQYSALPTRQVAS